MTFLPVFERELRVRARSRAAHWSRFGVALGAALLCLPQMLASFPFGGAASLGQMLLSTMVGAAFILCCASCLLTSDIISSERRQGTLGLLLLTRVSAFDVLVGKLGSAGLTSLCGLIAFLPMLMITVLAGGVTGGEAFRKELVLLNTLFLALAAGLWASARGREWLANSRNALLVLAAVILGPLLADLLFRSGGGVLARLTLLSPLGSLAAATDPQYKLSAAPYWVSLLLVQMAGWVLVWRANSQLRRRWQEEQGQVVSDRAARPAFAHPFSGGGGEGDANEPVGQEINPTAPATIFQPEAKQTQRPRLPLDDNIDPIAWRLGRQRGLSALLWAGALICSSNYWALPIVARLWGAMFFWMLISPVMLALAIVGGACFAWAASRFFVEARRTGELELLLSTPVGARQIVATQWGVLKRALRGPLVLILASTFCQAAITLVQIRKAPAIAGFPTAPEWEFLVGQAFNCLGLLLAVGALCWAGLWFGLRAAGQAGAIAWTVAIVTGVPMVLSILKLLLLAPLLRGVIGHNWLGYCVWTMLPQLLTLLYYLAIIYFARRSLLRRLAPGEPIPSLFSAARDAAGFLRKARHWTPR